MIVLQPTLCQEHCNVLVNCVRTWNNIVHIFVEESVKDQAKEAFGYTAVPYYVVFNKVCSNKGTSIRCHPFNVVRILCL